MYTNRRHYTLLIVAFAAIALTAVCYAVLYRAIESQSIFAQETLKALAAEDQKKQQAGDSASIYVKTADERARLDAAVLSQEKAVGFITAVEKIGTDTGTQLELSAISDEPIAGEGNLGYFKGHISAKGSWADVMRALSLIENMPYGISFDNVHVVAAAKTWELALDIRALTVEK